MHRFFVDKQDIHNDRIVLTGENAAHIATVLRLEPAEEIAVCDGEKTDYGCRIVSVSKKEVEVAIVSCAANAAEPQLQITLFQALPKADKMELIIQKAVELGAVRIVPVATQRCIAKVSEKNAAKTLRWQKIAESAAKQSRRGIIPLVGEALRFREAVLEAKKLDKAIAAYENEKAFTLKSFLRSAEFADTGTMGIFIGPEGGFSEDEISDFVESGILSVSLGERILRTETAGMAAIAVILYESEGKE